MDKVFINTQMEHTTKVNGNMTNKKVMVLKFGKMVQNMKDTKYKARSMEMASYITQTGMFMKVNSFKIISKVLENINGQREDLMTVNGI